MAALVSAGCGLLFGLGLWVSGMAEPAKVIGFLDVAGRWDPSLALVMGAAVSVTRIGYRRAFERPTPLLAARFHLPGSATADSRLVVGALLFGVGWGLFGYCPGPALIGLALGNKAAMVFVAAMLLGMITTRLRGHGPSASIQGGQT